MSTPIDAIITPWTKKLANVLEPFDSLVWLGLIGILAVTVWIMLSGNRTSRVLWLAFVLAP